MPSYVIRLVWFLALVVRQPPAQPNDPGFDHGRPNREQGSGAEKASGAVPMIRIRA
jgi:hypothetical protein